MSGVKLALSVPYHGSSLLKLGRVDHGRIVEISFSTLPRVELVETPTQARATTISTSTFSTLPRVELVETELDRMLLIVLGLSVPYHGSSLLKRGGHAGLLSGQGLSVPYHGSSLLKHGHNMILGESNFLSVPYHGSSLLKQEERLAERREDKPFSTLPRVELVETVVPAHQQPHDHAFQYPTTGRAC